MAIPTSSHRGCGDFALGFAVNNSNKMEQQPKMLSFVVLCDLKWTKKGV